MSDALEAALISIGVLAVVATVSLVIQLVQRLRLVRDFQVLTADMNLAEEVAGIGYWSRPITHKVATWSPGLFEIFGQDPKHFTPSHDAVCALFLPQDLPAVAALNDFDATGGKGGEVEAHIRCPNGIIKEVLVATRFQMKKGKVVGHFGVVADITARKAAQRAAIEREEQLQRAVSAMGAAIWDWDIGTDRLYAGPRFAEILGLDPQSFNPTMRLHHQLCHPDDLGIVQEGFRNSVQTGAPYAIEYRMRHSSGRYVWVHSRGRVVNYDGNRPVRAIGTVVDVTARHEADNELRRSRESLSLAMEASQAGHFDILSSSSEAYWSPRALEILGLNGKDYLPSASTLAQVIHPEDLPEFLADREELRLHGAPLDTQLRVKHGDGHYIWLHVRAVTLPLASGQTRTIGLILDVSAAVQAQQALADSERKFRNLIEGSIQGVLILRLRKPVFCNQAFARIFGYDRVEEVLALENLYMHVPPERIEEAKSDWDRAVRHELEGRIRRHKIYDRAGRTRWIEVAERLIQWEGDQARQLVALDVTDQELFQAKLRASEERFRLLADNVSDIITMYDQDQMLRYASPSFERVTGFKVDDMVGRDMYEIFLPEDRPTPEARAQLRKEPYVGTAVWRLVRKDRPPIYVESTSSLVPATGDNRGYGVVSALRDVTERVEREAELGAARDRLKNQADELTILAQNLEMERERSEQANAAKSQFLAMMSHELRTPMTGVLGMADLLLHSKMNEEQQDLTKLLKRSARALLDLLNDILDFSKIEAGQFEIESTSFNLFEVIDDVVQLFSPNASEKGLEINTNLPPLYWNIVKGDPTRLRQVLSNLVGNAIKFTERGSVTIGLEQREAPGDALTLVLSVTDTGIGIEAEDSTKLFKPFVQADISTSRKYGGTGLGLAISKRLVEGMGGKITLKSEVGHGSTFVFTVKVVPDRSVAQQAGPSVRAAGGEAVASPTAVTPRKILVAEDNETSRYLIQTMLRRLGHTVDVAVNGAEAVAAARAKTYDIVLMDMQMPVLDGTDATRAIRAFQAEAAHVPVIALTADVIAGHRSEYLAAGVNVIVSKPVNWSELTDEIERQLGGKPATAPVVNALPAGLKAEWAAASALDENALRMLVDVLGEDTLEPMLGTFSENMAKYLSELDTHVRGSDLKQAKRTAHALKGLCAQFGAQRASMLAKRIEMEAKCLKDVETLLPEVAAAIAATEEALVARRARGKPLLKSSQTR